MTCSFRAKKEKSEKKMIEMIVVKSGMFNVAVTNSHGS